MVVDLCCHAWAKDSFHVLSRVLLPCPYQQRTDRGNADPTRRSPAGRLEAGEPDLPERLYDRSSRPLCRLRLGASRIAVEMPEDCRLRESPKWRMRDNPTSNLQGSLGNWSALGERGASYC